MYQEASLTNALGTAANRRSARALHNDLSIRRATIKLILRQGIDAISFRDIGREAGLTHGALYARCEDVEELLIDVWTNELCSHVVAMVTLASQVVNRPDDATVHAVTSYIREASASDQAAVQVLLASRRFPILREEVEGFVGNYLEPSEEFSGTIHSRTLIVFSLMMTAITSGALFGPDEVCLEFIESNLREILKVDPATVAPLAIRDAVLPAIEPPGPDIRSQLAFATFSAVAKSGYMRATISRISRRADCSPGSIYKIYPSKDDLVMAAVRAVMMSPWITTKKFCSVLDEGELARLLSASASTSNDLRKRFLLELTLASSSNAKIRAVLGSQMRNIELPEVKGIDREQSSRLDCMIRLLTLLSFGVGFLSTLTPVEQLDFSQFAEPLRCALLEYVPSWRDVRDQLLTQGEPRRTEACPIPRAVLAESIW